MRTTNWALYTKRADFKDIAARYGIDQVTARIIRNRDVVGDKDINLFLNGTLDDLYDPALMRGVPEAAAILKEKIREKKKIRIIGDYDIDGVCSTYILLTTLKRLGADVDYDIPERINDGYGLNMRLVNEAALDKVDTILTCDNGISALDQAKAAKFYGMTMVITDHHQPVLKGEGEEQEVVLPTAAALIDPAVPGETYPYTTICGAVVAWKLMQYLTGDKLLDLLPYAAVATVGDVMDLTGENRVIVKHGLKALESCQDIGLRALIKATGLEERQISSYHIGFVLGPCINASGRLETAKEALDLFQTKDEKKAEELSLKLVELNTQRRAMTEEAVEKAVALIENSALKNDKVLIVYVEGCHESLAGIVAGKIRERYYKPSIVLTEASEEGKLKGSGRSIEAYHMHAHLTQCSSYLLGFGGHPMAAGLSLMKENLEAFRKAMNDNCGLTDADLIEKRMIDVPLPFSYIREDLIEEMEEKLAPFGKANERPQFALKDVRLSNMRIFGQKKNVLKCKITEPDGAFVSGIWFGNTDEFLASLCERKGADAYDKLLSSEGLTADLLYLPEINEYQGLRSIQIRIQEIK